MIGANNLDIIQEWPHDPITVEFLEQEIVAAVMRQHDAFWEADRLKPKDQQLVLYGDGVRDPPIDGRFDYMATQEMIDSDSGAASKWWEKQKELLR